MSSASASEMEHADKHETVTVETFESEDVVDEKLEEPAGRSGMFNLTPGARLYCIIASLCVVSFLAAFDNMVISSNTPFVAAEFNAFQLYGWVNTVKAQAFHVFNGCAFID
ncbi:hypothetical protein DM01DRAFT_1016256 [Hesseltinella vesiculosa]|uniref:Uncharacterized protein n=1 Tax=Hesseltinella vesiculosa TaxID=101127 RepID=A0A1X2GKQ8_9FUNG|nr:hypothetical protein DM01DRAFT_1016256 [Hesseltinella vesiculosa]